MRGSLGETDHRHTARGSIPAGAGKPHRRNDQSRGRGVYPRRCGEAGGECRPPRSVRGLSPQVRGSRSGNEQRLPASGSIPAGAGKPPPRDLRSMSRRVYPRRCGEARKVVSSAMVHVGLSPQVRGSHVPLAAAMPMLRSIPAGAGKPCEFQVCAPIGRVYPRRCGEAPARLSQPRTERGLSPQVRGSRRRRSWSIGSLGSIPAGAGKPRG